MLIKIPGISEVSPDFNRLNIRGLEIDQAKRKLEQELEALTEVQTTGHDPDRHARIDKLARGEVVEYPESTKARLETIKLNFADMLEASRTVDREKDKARRAASALIVERVRPEHDRLLKMIVKHVTELHSATAELYSMRQTMIDDGINVGNLFGILPSFMGHPRAKGSEWHDFFVEASRVGLCKIPKEFA